MGKLDEALALSAEYLGPQFTAQFAILIDLSS